MRRTSRYALILSAILCLSHTARAESGKSTAMVFDPVTKTYFIGREAKFMIKQGEGSSLIERIEVSVDGGEYSHYEGAIRFDREGKHTLKFRAVSPVNSWAPVQFIEAFVDLTPPATKATFQTERYFRDNEYLYAALNSRITLNAEDNLSGVQKIEFSWDGVSFEAYDVPIVVEKKGLQAIYVRSRDKVGNMEPAQRIEFVADGTAPISDMQIAGNVRPSIINGKNYLAASDSVAFSLKAEDKPAPLSKEAAEAGTQREVVSGIKTVWVSVDNKPYGPYLKPIYLLSGGGHTIRYYSEDNVGNKEEPKTVSIYTVSQPPRTIVQTSGKLVNTGGINFVTQDFRIALSAQENAVGLDRIELRTDQDSEWKTYLEPIRFLNPGPHKVAFRAVDRVGNREPTRTYGVIVQTTPPLTSIETAQPVVNREGITYSPSPNVLTLSVKNAGVGVDRTLVSINNAPFQKYGGPITISSKQRVYKIAFKSIDKLGNEEKTRYVTYHMIGSTPVVDLFVSDGQSPEEKVRTKYFENNTSRQPATGGKPKEPSKRLNQ